MKKSNPIKKSKKPLAIIIAVAITLSLVAVILYFFVFNKTQNASVVEIQKNKDNAKILEAEKNQNVAIITDDTQTNMETKDPQEVEPSTTQPTYDNYGPSTKLDRPDVHAAALSVAAIYKNFLDKLQATPLDQRQAVADQFIIDNKSIIGPNFNYLSSDSLHLLPQSANIALPDSISNYSAIVDPENSNQVIVQIIMEPDVTWSILVVTKAKDNLGNFGTIEKIIPRMNRNPL